MTLLQQPHYARVRSKYMNEIRRPRTNQNTDVNFYHHTLRNLNKSNQKNGFIAFILYCNTINCV